MAENPLVHIPQLLPLVHTVRSFGKDILANMRSFDIIHWDGTPYGAHPKQTLDIQEVNDLCPRDGWPTVLLLHGGGWIEGDKREFRDYMPLLAQQKIMAVSMNYRLADEVGWQEQVEDVLLAIDFLRSQQVDLQRIALWGISAGGHLALLAASRRPEQIRCVVTIGSPTNLAQLHPSSIPHSFFTNGTLSPEASPQHSSRHIPPTLLVHGEKDTVIPVEQSREFASTHPQATLWKVQDGDHGLHWPLYAGWKSKKDAMQWMIQQLDMPPSGSKWKRRKKNKK